MKWSMVWVAVLIGASCSAPPEEKGGDENSVVIITNNDANGETNNSQSGCQSDDECGAGEVCRDGFCQVEGCEPQCDGKTCGANGCGGVCGMCEGRATCLDGACEVEPLDCSGFETDATNWSIPGDVFVDDQFQMTADLGGDCGEASGAFRHTTMDLTGDGLADLVVTDKCDGAGVGTNRWEVYENTGSGFAASASMWSLPEGVFVDDQFEMTADLGGDCGEASGVFRHTTMDLTGDGAPDLVVTDKCDEAGVGTNRWEVYENTGSGFAASASMWSLPEDVFVDDQFDMTADLGGDCGEASGVFRHTTMDLTGDGLVDLVVTDKCDEAGVGTNRWEVYENTGSGFATDAAMWSLPEDVFVDDQFDMTADLGGDCGEASGVFRHSTMDLTGDGLVDLVVTDKCDEAGVGTNRWEVYENTGSGFAASASMWSLPEDVFVDDQFDMTADLGGDCGEASGVFRHQLLDMDADGLVDLLVSDKCDGAGVGTNRWEYFRNQGNGFAQQTTNWSLPQFFVDEQLDMVADNGSDCGEASGVFRYLTMDLDGNSTPDLVVTDKCDGAGVGTNRWEVYSASCN